MTFEDFDDREPDLDWIRDEEEQRNGPPQVIEGRVNLGVGDEASWSHVVEEIAKTDGDR